MKSNRHFDLFKELDIADVDVLAGIDILDRARYIALFFDKQLVGSGRVALEPEIAKLVGLQTFFAAVSPGQRNRTVFEAFVFCRIPYLAGYKKLIEQALVVNPGAGIFFRLVDLEL